MPDLDWQKCPVCGEVEAFEIQTDERLYGSSSLRLELKDDGSLDHADSIDTEVGFNTAKVLGYYASCCMNTMPDAYCEALDAAMDIERVTE